MTRTIQLFLLSEGIIFFAAALVHAGSLLAGYEHREARIAEIVIALVLLAGLALSWIQPRWTRAAGLGVQAFALLGTLVGVFTIVIGVGPRTAPDVLYHVGIVPVLIWA
ncbi:MAG: hypothetical protein ACRD2X_15900 [Vicinamibacteraceae bacterium]